MVPDKWDAKMEGDMRRFEWEGQNDGGKIKETKTTN
jgi:hypothetical protein